jgi:glucokinase
MAEQLRNIGVDVGGTNVKIALLNEDGKILLRRSAPTRAELGPDAVIQEIRKMIEALLKESSTPAEALHSIGIGVPGTADAATGTVVYAPNIFWKNVAVGPVLQSTFRVPVYVAQDTRAAAWAEYLVGEARGTRSLASVTLGTGVGCGLVFDGAIFHGGMNTAGEFGHQIVVFEGESCNCGRRGCLEAHAGGLAIVRQAKQRFQSMSAQQSELTVDDVYRLSLQQEPEARKLTDDVVKYVGIGLVNLINLTSVEMICLSGGISNAPASLLLDPLVAFVRANVYQTVADRVRICRSALGEDAPLIGASLLHRGMATPAGTA